MNAKDNEGIMPVIIVTAVTNILPLYGNGRLFLKLGERLYRGLLSN
jgi:hypothetical protein